jgi:hypothetical protein
VPFQRLLEQTEEVGRLAGGLRAAVPRQREQAKKGAKDKNHNQVENNPHATVRS